MVELNEAQEKDVDELDNDYQLEDESPNVFKVRDALNPPSAMSYSAQELHSASANYATHGIFLHTFGPSEYIHEGLIDLDPVYQRGKLIAAKKISSQLILEY